MASQVNVATGPSCAAYRRYTAMVCARHRTATYVDKLLTGAKPAYLPVEQPSQFDLIIDLRAAQALGLTVPQHVLLQATEVLQ